MRLIHVHSVVLLACMAGSIGAQQPPSEVPKQLHLRFWEYGSPTPQFTRRGSGGDRPIVDSEGNLTTHHWVYFDQSFSAFQVSVERAPEQGDFLVTLKPWTISPEEAFASRLSVDSLAPIIDPKKLVIVPLVDYPVRQRIRHGGTISVNTVAGDANNQHLVCNMTLFDDPPMSPDRAFELQRERSRAIAQATREATQGIPRPSFPPPITSREFTLEDVEIAITEPTVRLNGQLQNVAGSQRAKGPLVWTYIPGKGRYILSLSAWPNIGLHPAGTLQGTSIQLAIDGDYIQIDSPVPSFLSPDAFTIFAFRDTAFSPASESDRPHVVLGTVSARELQLLRTQ